MWYTVHPRADGRQPGSRSRTYTSNPPQTKTQREVHSDAGKLHPVDSYGTRHHETRKGHKGELRVNALRKQTKKYSKGWNIQLSLSIKKQKGE